MDEKSTTGHPKTCLECGQPLGAGRSDRKYCDDVCRTAYNNSRRSAPVNPPAERFRPNKAFEKIFRILLGNRETLMMYNTYKQEPYMLRDLLGKGFNPKYFTSEFTIKDLPFRFCFDFGYHITDSGRVYIEERSEEIFC